MDAAGKAGQPVDIWMDQAIKGPDGMRAANGKLLVAENGSGKISVITVNGDKASVSVIKEGIKTPTAAEPAGDTGSPNAAPARQCLFRCRNDRERLVDKSRLCA
jgi:hypothetical protein